MNTGLTNTEKSTKMKTEKAKVILLLSKNFPKGHRRAGELTNFHFNMENGKKIHTVRANKENVWDQRCLDIALGKKYLTVREWTGKPYNSEQKEIARYDRIVIQKIIMTYGDNDAAPQCWIDGKAVPVEEVAMNDGLSVEDFVDWFFGQTNNHFFEGIVIHFTDFRY